MTPLQCVMCQQPSSSYVCSTGCDERLDRLLDRVLAERQSIDAYDGRLRDALLARWRRHVHASLDALIARHRRPE